MKAQILADFVAECQFATSSQNEETQSSKPWKLYVDESSTTSTGGAEVILISSKEFKIQQALKFSFPVTNNVIEYEALIVGIKLAVGIQVKMLDTFGDSQLVAKQVKVDFKTHNDRMTTYLNQSLALLQSIPSWTITNVGREENQWDDALSKLASSTILSNEEPIYVEVRSTPAIEGYITNEIHNLDDWRQPFFGLHT